MAIAAVGTGNKKQNIDTAGEALQLVGTVGHPVANGVEGYKVGSLRQSRLDIGDELLVFLAAFGSLGIESYGTGEIDVFQIIRGTGDNGSAIGLARKANHLGVTGFPKDYYLPPATLHLIIALADALLKGKDNRAGGIDEADTQFVGSAIGSGRLSVCTDEHLFARELRKTAMVDYLQSQATQALYFGAVVHDVAQAIETAVARQLFLGGSNGFHHPEAITRIIVNPNFQFFIL